MEKLYKKSPLLHALAFIIIYVVGSGTADGISETAGIPKLLTVLFHAALSIIIFLWMKRSAHLEHFGLCSPHLCAHKAVLYVPLAVLSTSSVWFGFAVNHGGLQAVLFAVSMLCTGFLEEVVFRGFLYRAMEKDSPRAAVAVTSITFGIGHIINLLNGADVIPTVCQICCAVAFGYLFVTVFRVSGSIVPCIVSHSTVNVLSVFARSAPSAIADVAVSAVIAVLASSVALLVAVKMAKKS